MPRKILLFDDEQNSLSKVYFYLLQEDYVVEATIDPAEIVARTERLLPDLVLLNSDVNGFDGAKVCATIKRKHKVPVVLMLEKDSPARIKIDGCHADAIVYKPIDLDHLKQVLLHLIAAR